MNAAWLDAWAAGMMRAAWQGGGALLVVWGVCALFRRADPGVKCWLWRLGYLKFPAAVLLAASISVPLLPAERGVALGGTTNGSPGARAVSSIPDSPPTAGPEAAAPIAAVTPARGAASSVQEASVAGAAPDHVLGSRTRVTEAADTPAWSRRQLVVMSLMAVWLVGVGVGVVRMMGSWKRTRALRRAATPVDDPVLQDLLAGLAARLHVRRVPRLLEAPDGTGPLLTGVLDPAILIPRALLAESSADALRLALTHELAHVRRRDLLWNLLHAAVETVFFFHPLIWLARRQCRYCQELACDHLTLTASKTSPTTYGQALLGILALQRKPAPAFAGVGVADSVKTLRRRLLAMTTFRAWSSRRTALAATLILLGAVAGILPWRLVAHAGPPIAASAGPAAPAQTSPALTVELAATVVEPGRSAAVLRLSDGSVKTCGIGDSVEDVGGPVVLTEVNRDRVLVSYAGTRRELRLTPAASRPTETAVPARAADSRSVIAHWSFDRREPDGTYGDSVENRHPATPADKAEVKIYSDSAAPFGNAVAFLGPSHPQSYLTIPPLTNIQTTSFTVATWVNLASQNTAFVLADWPSIAQSAYAFGFHPFGRNNLTAQPVGNIASIETTSVRPGSNRLSIIDQKLADRAVPLNEWHHVAWVWDRNKETLTFYCDGTEWGEARRTPVNPNYSKSLDIAVSNLPVRIGSQELTFTGAPANLTGALDELWIFDEALVPLQIRNLIKFNDIRGARAVGAPASIAAASRAAADARSRALADMAMLKTGLDTFEVDIGRYPVTAEGLDAIFAAPAILKGRWRGPYLQKMPVDPWGFYYLYRYPGVENPTSFDLFSAGPDGTSGTADDIKWRAGAPATSTAGPRGAAVTEVARTTDLPSAAEIAAATGLSNTTMTQVIPIRFNRDGAAGVRDLLTRQGFLGRSTTVGLDDRGKAVIVTGTGANIHRLAEIIALWEYESAQSLNAPGGLAGRRGARSEAGKPEEMPPVVYEFRAALRVPVVEVQSAVEGRVSAIVPKEGQYVKTGTVLLQLDDRAAKDAVQLADLNVRRAVADGDRVRMDEAPLQLKMAQTALDDTRIVAPISGYVQTFDVQPGQLVSRGTRVTTIAADELQVAMNLPVGVARDLRVGQTFTLRADNEPPATGEIDFISATETPPDPNARGAAQASSYFVRGKVLSGDRLDHLKSGMTAMVYLTLEAAK
jgi:type II secretion system protein G